LTTITIAIDAMGGDFGPEVTVPAALQALTQTPNLKLTLVGDEAVLNTELAKHASVSAARLTIKHASQQVDMGELPSHALRKKRDSSMRVALNLVKQGEAAACVSAGNTGALMAMAHFVLKMIPGVDRPAIMNSFPIMQDGKEVHVLDLGANVDSFPENLYQFAIMGSVTVEAIGQIKHPKVGLLNIGAEEIKGNHQVKKTAKLLAESKLINFVGSVEGNQIFQGVADVVVCDGFVGNVTLKVMAGVIELVAKFAKDAFMQNPWTRFAGLVAMPVLRGLKKRIDPDQFNGASLLGLRGIVIKSHGDAHASGFVYAINQALIEVENNIPQRIHDQVSAMLEESAAP